MTFLYNRINYGISIEILMLYFLGSPTDPSPITEIGENKVLQNVLASDPILFGGPSVPQDGWVARMVEKCDQS